jgi:hypothetical protein
MPLLVNSALQNWQNAFLTMTLELEAPAELVAPAELDATNEPDSF